MKESKLKWQCRRGMRELDFLLTRFLDTKYDYVSSEQKLAFHRLLDLSDPELNSFLLVGLVPEDPIMEELVNNIIH